MMTTLALSLNRATFTSDRTCAVCAAEFVPAEDSGSRLLSLKTADQGPIAVLMCGGCYSKWSHGTAVTARVDGDAAVVPVLRHPERG
jgi:hypothetical protein